MVRQFWILAHLEVEMVARAVLNSNVIEIHPHMFRCLAYIFVVFVPILPSGAFFGDYLVTLFWINISIMFSVLEYILVILIITSGSFCQKHMNHDW